MTTYKQAAFQILREAGEPLHYTDITERAIEKGILERSSKTSELSMHVALTLDIRRNNQESNFIKEAPGKFALNLKKRQLQKPSDINETQNTEEEIEEFVDVYEEVEEDEKTAKAKTIFTGKAGEHLVCSKLIFCDFNASIISVDEGVDIIAFKDNQVFFMQVKTANLSSKDSYNYNIRKVPFKRYDKGNVFYVFIMHGKEQDNFLILSAPEIEKKIKEKAIWEANTEAGYSVSIKLKDEKVFLGNKSHEMGYFLNNWDLIK